MLLRLDWTPQDQRWKVVVSAADPTQVIFVGDGTKSAKHVAKQARAHRQPAAVSDWHMEPLAAIHNACEDSNKRTVGGDLQLAKTFRHGAARAYGFVDAGRGEDAVVRGVRVNPRAKRELAGNALLIDLSRWQLHAGYYAARCDRANDLHDMAGGPPGRDLSSELLESLAKVGRVIGRSHLEQRLHDRGALHRLGFAANQMTQRRPLTNVLPTPGTVSLSSASSRPLPVRSAMARRHAASARHFSNSAYWRRLDGNHTLLYRRGAERCGYSVFSVW